MPAPKDEPQTKPAPALTSNQAPAPTTDANAEVGPQNTEEARAQSMDTLKQQESMKPEPSQEEADEMKVRASQTGQGADYKNRALKSD